MANFQYITETATKPARTWSNVEKLKFHYFNPNGLVARKRANNARIRELVDAGVVPAGWIVAYGTFNSYREERVIELANKRRVGSIETSVAIKMLAEECEKVEAKIAEAEQAGDPWERNEHGAIVGLKETAA